MEVANIYKLKNKYNLLSDDFIKDLEDNNFFCHKIKKINYKKNKNFFMNKKLQNKKNIIGNKINMILNKLSEDNIDNLILEFIEKIGIIDNNNFNIFIENVYKKIILEIEFINFYIKFFSIISNIYQKKFNYNIKYFFDIIENKILNDYLGIQKDNLIINISPENYRINNLKIIKFLLKNNIIDNSFNSLIDSIILNQENYLVDINFWYSDRKLTKNIKNKINLILNKDISFRDRTLLNNLINENKVIINKKVKTDEINNNNQKVKKNKSKNIDVIEIENIYDEYAYLKMKDEVKMYLLEECKNSYKKNLFCKIGLIYFSENKENSLLDLFDYLLENKVLFKSNLSRGLIYFEKDNKVVNKNNFLKYLKFLKNRGITKGIENILAKNQI